ncbi:hypothetical protein [Nocardioides speluncae]|uniref:hypothetical protein n=1 Tax=Nocardioides speluncae TaxID=2670337 RepID=UPI0012B171B4|nr:hypothetical protein [Nocardioides speluncae]
MDYLTRQTAEALEAAFPGEIPDYVFAEVIDLIVEARRRTSRTCSSRMRSTARPCKGLEAPARRGDLSG